MKPPGFNVANSNGFGQWSIPPWHFSWFTPTDPKKPLWPSLKTGKEFSSATTTALYVKWMKRQACLAHYIRKAKALTEKKADDIQRFGHAVLKELRLLCHWSKSPPNDNEWNAFYTRFVHLLAEQENADNDAGKLSRSLIREMITLWVFLEEQGVEPTNNRAERALRAGVLWRKRSKGTQSDKGDRWVERILSLKQTCRMRLIPTFPILVEAIDSVFKERKPNLNWLG
jgi:transposase